MRYFLTTFWCVFYIVALSMCIPVMIVLHPFGIADEFGRKMDRFFQRLDDIIYRTDRP